MPFDPLFQEAPPSPALRAELGIPDGTALRYLRLTGEGVRFRTIKVTPDGVPHPRQRGKGRTLRGYEVVYVYSRDAVAEGRGGWWGPGQLWLARIRFGEDRVYGELRPPRPDEPHGPLRRSVTEEGETSPADRGARQRAWRGVDFLWGEISMPGRIPDEEWQPTVASDHEREIRDALQTVGRQGREYLTQQKVAEYLHRDPSTIRKWLGPGRWKVLKRAALQIVSHA